MPSFDVALRGRPPGDPQRGRPGSREVTNRFDFKGTEPAIELDETTIKMHCASEDRLNALRQVLEEKLVKRQVSLKAVDYGKVEEASGGTVRQTVTLVAGISSDKAKRAQQVHQGARASRACSPRPRASRSGSPARSVTTCRR